ncbi:MAG: hypothetical protein M1834_009652 [Cirrosporium novae-zelandiae]|nr:MAG: hypothetical protein M1834_009652 [Cirrosporium novae-zelandiae]
MGDEGATPRELLLEACRRNNTELLTEIISSITDTEKMALLLNDAKDGVGNHALHVAATYGSYLLLDQEGLEVDPIDRLEGDTPLHKAVRFINSQDTEHWEGTKALVELLVDAGADPRVRNRAHLTPRDLVDPRNTELRKFLQHAEYAMVIGDDVVNYDEDDGPAGSASDSE